MQRRRFKQTTSLDQRLTQEAQRLRKEAQGIPPGIERSVCDFVLQVPGLMIAADLAHRRLVQLK